MRDILTSCVWIFPGFIGLLVGLSELLNRYKSFERLFNLYSGIYMLINFSASVLVYFIFKIYGINPTEKTNSELGRILISGISAMAFLRSSFFNYKTSNDKTIEVGPAAFLGIFLNAAQRQFDQTLSKQNLPELRGIMKGVNFLSASKDLPVIILSSLRILSKEEQTELSDEILKLVNDPNAATLEVKNLTLGIVLLKHTGMDLLKIAVDILKEIYEEQQAKLTNLKNIKEKLSIIVK